VARSLLALGYVAAALCWLRASQQARLAPADAFARWWLLGAAVLLLLAVNKQFNLRAHFETGFRALMNAGSWYDHRQPMQFFLALVLPVVLAVSAGVFLAPRARVFVRGHPLALVGWLLLLLYQVLRQAQEWKPMLHWLDSLRYHDWRLALELAGMLLVALAAPIARAPLSVPQQT